MRLAVFSTKAYERKALEAANEDGHELTFLDARLAPETAPLARGYPAVCAFVNDVVDATTIETLAEGGTRLVLLRAAGYNNVDLQAAARHDVTVARVPAYSPHAVAEHALALMLTLNRRTHRAFNRVREGNFALDGLLGFDLHGKTVGVIGTGTIGAVFARIVLGLGCRVLAHDPQPSAEVERLGARYVPLEELLESADVVVLHCPLTKETHHLLDAVAFARMKKGVMVINTSRGALIDTKAAIAALKSGIIGHLGLDVYEEEGELFFEDHSRHVIQDDVFARLLTFPNVLITGHQGFFTREALAGIAETTLRNLTAFERGEGELHRVAARA